MPLADFNKANASLDRLPPEILMHIVSYLEPKELAKFQRICKALLRLGRDNGLWLEHCFERSSMYESVWLPRLRQARQARQARPASVQNETTADDDQTVAPNTAQDANEPPENPGHPAPHSLFLVNALGNIVPANQVFPTDPNQLTPTMVIQLAATGNLPFNTPLAVLQQAIQQLNTNFQLGSSFLDDDHVGVADPDQDGESDGQGSETSNQDDDVDVVRNSKQEKVRIRANWDPSYPNEEVSWYNEYIHRHAPTVVNWFEPARRKDAHRRWANTEARGLALYRPDGNTSDSVGQDTVLAISPLDDGGICIWDVNGTRGKKGSIFAQSNPGLLFVDGPQSDNSRASKRVDSGVTECVSVDNQRHRAFFAVQSHLIDVDLQTMSVVGCESFPWSITAISSADATVPLTIATSLGIHLHDYKSRPSTPVDHDERVDGFSSIGAQYFYEQGLRNLFTDVPLPPYAPLSQPGPLSILHLQEPGSLADVSDDIYVAGRFSNILHYDRRSFPTIKDSIYSGGSLCSMTSSPYPFSALCSERRRRGQMSVEEVEGSKSLPGGRALIACGEHNSKGTLEIYGLSPSPDQSGKMEITGHQNRYTASGAKLLSVVNHGARIAASDAHGFIRWFERDGFTEIQDRRIGPYPGSWDVPAVAAQGPMVTYAMQTEDEIARKILPTGPAGCGSGGSGGSGSGSGSVNDNDLLFWTGDKVGSIGFTTAKGIVPDDFLPKQKVTKKAVKEKRYTNAMRTALAHQADEARWFGGCGAGHD